MIKALFFDLDGTLLNSEKKIPRSAREALRACRQKGIRVFLASARSPRLSETLGWTAEEFSLFDGGIYSNGGYVEAAGKKEYAFIDAGTVKKCVEAVCGYPNVHLSLHTPGHGYAFNFPFNEELKAGWGITEENLRPLNDDTMEQTAKMLVFWGNLVGERALMPEALCRKMEEICRERARLYITDQGAAMQLTSLQAGKKTAVDYVREQLFLKADEIIFFGDDLNDLEVIRAYPVTVAMGNGAEEVKQAAKYVTAANDEDGIAQAIRMLGLIEN